MTSGNRSFSSRNPGLILVFAGAYLLFNWLLHTNARIDGYASLVSMLASFPWWQAPLRYVWIGFVSPWPALLISAAMGGYYYFADSPADKWKRFKIGVLGHGLWHVGAAIIVTSAIIWGLGKLVFMAMPVQGFFPTLAQAAIVTVASIAAAMLSGKIFGLYLWRNLNRHGRHWSEAFSALAIAGYKNFLRMKIDRHGNLHLYPIGLTDVPAGGGTPATLKTHLIEGPIKIV